MSDILFNSMSIGGASYEIRRVTGVVLDTNTRSETTVSGGGGGGGGMVVGGTGTVGSAPVSVTSTTTRFTKIFLRDRQGTEHAVQLVDFDVLCRPGNVLTIVTSWTPGTKKGKYLAVYNHDAKKLTYDTEVLGDYLSGPWIPFLATYLVSLAVKLAIGLAVFLGLVGIALGMEAMKITAALLIFAGFGLVIYLVGGGVVSAKRRRGDKLASAFIEGSGGSEIRKKLEEIQTKDLVTA